MQAEEAQKTAILLIGHGSRAEGANEGQYRVAADLRSSGRYALVECAFLEINQPDIPAGLTACRASGASRIVVMPYFLHLGNHVRQDLPRLIGEWQQVHPGLEVAISPPLGYGPQITRLVEERIRQAINPAME
jgi:sirohydrochlorin ferrochelatase